MSDELDFRPPEPSELTGPKTVEEANWLAKQSAEARERATAAGNRQLLKKLHKAELESVRLQLENAAMKDGIALKERLDSRARWASTVAFGLATMLGGWALEAWHGKHPASEVIVLAVSFVIFFVVGAVVHRFLSVKCKAPKGRLLQILTPVDPP